MWELGAGGWGLGAELRGEVEGVQTSRMLLERNRKLSYIVIVTYLRTATTLESIYRI